MNDLIVIAEKEVGTSVVQTVNARELHAFLGNATRFNDWIASRIEQFDFVENQDFTTFTENPVKGRPSKEYHITLSMGKELGMVERSEKGKEIRKYFIECERRALQPVLPRTYAEALRVLASEVEEKERLLQENQQQQLQIAHDQPKVDVYDTLVESENLVTIDAAAKMLKLKPTQFRDWLKWEGILRKDPANKGLPTADTMNKGYMECKLTDWDNGKYSGTSTTPYFRNEGVIYIQSRLQKFFKKYPEMYNKFFS